MTPFFADDHLTVYQGDCSEVMAAMEPESVHCVVTSPPYWGLRDYGTATWVGGDEGCDHRIGRVMGNDNKGAVRDVLDGDRSACKCGAVRQDSQLGLEPTPEAFVANMVAVFREVRRVLRKDGTLWLNLGDSYGQNQGAGFDTNKDGGHRKAAASLGRTPTRTGLKPKDLVGIPWRVAFALQQPYYTGAIKDERDRTWLAALMDGEGTFTILATNSASGSMSYPPIAQVRMTSAAVVGKAASLVGVMSPAQYPPSAKYNRAVYQWRLSGRRAADVARELYPYLLEKRKQALIAWNHQEVRDGYETKRGVFMPAEARAKQIVCRDLIRRLNHGESVDIPSWMVEPPPMTEPGWYLRSDVIWSKPNPMPESVTDRPTKAHEYLFLLTKSARYYYDADAVREDVSGGTHSHGRADARMTQPKANTGAFGVKGIASFQAAMADLDPALGRNLRSVWSIATEPYPGAHFATFPRKLVEPCVKAGTSERGVCPECGAPWRRIIARGDLVRDDGSAVKLVDPIKRDVSLSAWSRPGGKVETVVPNSHRETVTTGWQPTCDPKVCMRQEIPEWEPAEPVPAIVLDPFAGSGTTGMVAQALGRRAVLIDLNGEYLVQAMARNAQTPLGMIG